MKPIFRLLILLLCIALIHRATAQCTMPTTICFKDGFGYAYNFSNPTLTDLNVYTAEGTSTAYTSSNTTVRLDLTHGINAGTIKMVVRNNAANDCNNYTDSFIYNGTVKIEEGDNHKITFFSALGYWTSYCHGEVFGTGKWTAKGPCGYKYDLQRQSGIAPADGAQKMMEYKKGIVVSPNPANATTTIHYNIKDAGKASITVFNSMNLPVKLLIDELKSPGSYSVQWNLQDRNGAKVPTGIYRVVLTTASGTWYNSIQVLNN